MRKITLNWKPQKSWIEDLLGDNYKEIKEIAEKIAYELKPTSFKDINDLYHGEGKYHFISNFKEYVNGRVDSIKERITALSSPEANISFHEQMLELTPDAFKQFMENVFNTDFAVNASNFYNPNWHENILQSLGSGDGVPFDPMIIIDQIKEGIEHAAEFLISVFIGS